jgi:hypothetical protein
MLYHDYCAICLIYPNIPVCSQCPNGARFITALRFGIDHAGVTG